MRIPYWLIVGSLLSASFAWAQTPNLNFPCSSVVSSILRNAHYINGTSGALPRDIAVAHSSIQKGRQETWTFSKNGKKQSILVLVKRGKKDRVLTPAEQSELTRAKKDPAIAQAMKREDRATYILSSQQSGGRSLTLFLGDECNPQELHQEERPTGSSWFERSTSFFNLDEAYCRKFPEKSEALHKLLSQRWKSYGFGSHAKADRYLVRRENRTRALCTRYFPAPTATARLQRGVSSPAQ